MWGGNRDPIKRSKAVQKISSGGLGMLDVQAFVRRLKLSWLKRLKTSEADWAILARNELPDIDNILRYGSEKNTKKLS